MKIIPAFLLCSAAVCFATCLPAKDQQAPAPWGAGGCNKALLDGEFALTNAPAMPCAEPQKEFIDKVIDEVWRGYGGTMVGTESPNPLMDTPEFTAFFLRAFAEPTDPLDAYVYRLSCLSFRASQHTPMIEDGDSRLDWDMWRAWLWSENLANTSADWYKDWNNTRTAWFEAGKLLWDYLYHNADAILKDAKRRAWWIKQLTTDLEAEGGRPMRRWLLLLLLAKADTKREAMEKTPMPEKFIYDHGRKIPSRQPNPIDPFLIVTGKDEKIPLFSDALTKIAFDNGLSLTVLGIDPATEPVTEVRTISLSFISQWLSDRSKVINQESWSAPGSSGYEWGVRFNLPGSRRDYSSPPSSALPDRTDGVFFFVFNQRLYVWPKAKMDAAVLQMLRIANLIDAATAADFERRGFALKETLVKERP